jgi:hypothetical protein
MNTISNTNQTDETSDQFTLMKSPMPTYLLEDFRVQLFRLLEEEQGSVQKIHAVLSFLRSADSLLVKESHMYSLKMLRDSSTMTEDEPLELSSQVWMNWGMTSNGSVLTARISESHRIGNEYLLSEVLEDTPDPKYFLSEGALQRMQNRAQHHKEKGNGFGQVIYQRSTHTITKVEAQEQSLTKDSPQMDMFGQPTGDETTSEM